MAEVTFGNGEYAMSVFPKTVKVRQHFLDLIKNGKVPTPEKPKTASQMSKDRKKKQLQEDQEKNDAAATNATVDSAVKSKEKQLASMRKGKKAAAEGESILNRHALVSAPGVET